MNIQSPATAGTSGGNYSIQAAPPSDRYARGWHVLGLSETFRDGKPHEIEIFGSKLVVFAGEDGKITILDGYCPHMGASLGQGEIIGNNVSCPFHGWQWGSDGRCAKIPFSPRIPPRAKIKSWPVMEASGQLFVYHDPENNPPPPEIAIPSIEPYDRGECTPWNWETLVIPTNCRELIDNVSDNTHFYYVHGWLPRRFKNIFNGHIASQIALYETRKDRALGAEGEAENEDSFSMDSDGTYYGPAYMINRQAAMYKGQQIDCWLINAHYPITPNSFLLHCGVTARKVPGLPEEVATAVANEYAVAFRNSFFQDVHIWQHKTRIDNPILTQYDGPIYQLRRWYEQFYVDVADIQPDMVDYQEIEVDMTKPNEAWEAEQALLER
ncbi:MAG: Rieske 2Fe-2S domain-containing protein [Sphingomonadaceae bacterium]